MDELLLSRFGAMRVSVSACVYRRVTPSPPAVCERVPCFQPLASGEGSCKYLNALSFFTSCVITKDLANEGGHGNRTQAANLPGPNDGCLALNS